jgi:hypothetical protein
MRIFLPLTRDWRAEALDTIPGNPRGMVLQANERERFERRFQADFSGVRLYYRPALGWLGLGAVASGNAIYHAVAPTRALIEHELGHIVQQRRAGVDAARGPMALLDDSRLEADVDACPDALREVAAAGYRPAQPIKMRYGWCNYAHVLSAMDEAVNGLGAGADPFAGKDKTKSKVQFRIQSAANWVYLANRKALKAPGRLPCLVTIANGTPVSCATGGLAGGERVFFPGGKDLNYEGVAEGATLFKGKDAAWAQFILNRAAGMDNTVVDAASDWVDALIVLLFGMETARFHSGLCATVLFLDLIANAKAYGRTGRQFGFDNAFHMGSWEDGEWYGGKYPYATHGTGSGNNYMRNVLAKDYQLALANHFAGLPQRHAVPRREVSLCVHWLESSLGPTPDLYDDDLNTKIQNALSGRLKDFYWRNQARANLRFSPNATSGVSAFGGDKGAKAALPNMDAMIWWHKVPYEGKNPTKYYHAAENPQCGARTGVARGPILIQQEKENFQRTMEERGKPTEKAQATAFSRPEWNAIREQSMSASNWCTCTRRAAQQGGYKPCPKCFSI